MCNTHQIQGLGSYELAVYMERGLYEWRATGSGITEFISFLIYASVGAPERVDKFIFGYLKKDINNSRTD